MNDNDFKLAHEKHDNEKAINYYPDDHKCDLCEEVVSKQSDLNEATGKKGVELICNGCFESYDICLRCDRSIIERQYDNDTYCDSCCDIIADSWEDR
jgi:hypothetical protein